MKRCTACGRETDDLMMGACFSCASEAEQRAAKRSVWAHIKRGISNWRQGRKLFAKIDFRWAWQRLTRTGDYRRGGTFDWEGYDWR